MAANELGRVACGAGKNGWTSKNSLQVLGGATGWKGDGWAGKGLQPGVGTWVGQPKQLLGAGEWGICYEGGPILYMGLFGRKSARRDLWKFLATFPAGLTIDFTLIDRKCHQW